MSTEGSSEIAEGILSDRRRNLVDENHDSWYVKDETGRGVAGPFGSASYAGKVLERMRDKWSHKLEIVRVPNNDTGDGN